MADRDVTDCEDQRVLSRNSSTSSTSSDDSDYTPASRGSGRSNLLPAQSQSWWFQQPAVKKNCCIVIAAWFLVVFGVLAILAGVGLEAARHHSDEVIRGIIFILVGIVVLIPGVYAVLHIYLAAKRVGRIRLSSVWFFR